MAHLSLTLICVGLLPKPEIAIPSDDVLDAENTALTHAPARLRVVVGSPACSHGLGG